MINSTKNIVGIDYSLTSPAMTVKSDSHFHSYFMTAKSKLIGEIYELSPTHSLYALEYPSWISEEDRHFNLADAFIQKIPQRAVVLIEGYSFGSSGKRLFQLAENTGCLKQNLALKKYNFDVIAPTAVKKFATGKGNSNKDMMVQSFVESTSINISKILGMKEGSFASPISDIVDSYWICKYLENCQLRVN